MLNLCSAIPRNVTIACNEIKESVSMSHLQVTILGLLNLSHIKTELVLNNNSDNPQKMLPIPTLIPRLQKNVDFCKKWDQNNGHQK